VTLSACQIVQKSKIVESKDGEIKLMILEPGHFHADLLLKNSSSRVFPEIYIYAPAGTELKQHLNRINSYNNREVNPTSWKTNVCEDDDYLKKMLTQKKGNVVILAGNNKKKTDYIYKSVEAGLNVLADKPLAINELDFTHLKNALELAKKNKVLIWDVMTERFDILNIIQKKIIEDSTLFGVLETGSEDIPAIYLESVHHFYKTVSGKVLVRPAWYYDVEQQGEGIVDVTTHLIDIINWKCFSNSTLDYTKDVKLLSAKHWTTDLSLHEFSMSTQLGSFPSYLSKYISENTLKVYSNGEIHYSINKTNIAVRVQWNFKAADGESDTHSSVIKGTHSICKVVQNVETGNLPQLYIYKNEGIDKDVFFKSLTSFISKLKVNFPFISIKQVGDKFLINIPVENRENHEEHFSKAANSYYDFLSVHKIPKWELCNLLTKYYITTSALKMAESN
jgi:predicted dehydrogenase